MSREPSFQHRGMWWFYPSLLEACEGPWDGSQPASVDPVAEWKRILDYMAAKNMNTLFAQFCPVQFDWCWGLHWVLEFRGFPGAAVHDPEIIRRRQERVRRILDYARQRGIEVFIHHYNFEATYDFVKSHESIYEKWSENARKQVGRPFVDPLKWVCGDICFNEPVYREYLKGCWREAFEVFPSLGGFVITMGEDANCSCPQCSGPANKKRTMIRFADFFAESMRSFGRKPVARTWFYARNLYDSMY